MIRFTTWSHIFARSLAVVVLAITALAILGTDDSTAEARESRTAVFGTVVDAPVDGNLEVVTRDGILTLIITEDTRIDKKRGTLKLDEVTSGTSVIGYYFESDDTLTAGKLTFRERNKKSNHKHLVGVVTKKNGDSLTVRTTDGDEVEIESSNEPTDDDTEQGSLIVTIVETDEETGDIDAVAVRTAEQTIGRLNDAIGHEITLAQEKLLKARMSETASIHLTRLYETLDEIQAEAQEKIEAAFAEFQSSYTSTLEENLISPPLVLFTGKVLTRNSDQIVIAQKGNGKRSYITIGPDVKVELLDGEEGQIGDAQPDAWVEIYAVPRTKTSSPIAQIIKIIPTPAPPNNSGDASSPDDETITGTIVLVDDGNSGTQQIIVVDNPDGSDGAAAVTPETSVTGDDDLVPGQEVEIVLGDDGFSANEVVVVSSPSDGTEPTATQSPPVEYKLIGKIRELVNSGIDSGGTTGVILDDVFLSLDSFSPETDPLEVGQEMQFTVVVDEDGRWVIVGIDQ
jgi:hypothetical protein